MRHKHLLTTCCFTLLLILLAAPSVLQADICYKMKVTNSGMPMGDTLIGAGESFQTIWMGDKMALMDMDTAASIIDMEKKIMYMIDHNHKTFAEMPIGDSEKRMEALGISSDDPEAKAMFEMYKKMLGELTVKVTPTKETKKIGDYNCTKYLVKTEVGREGGFSVVMNTETWATKDIGVDMSQYYYLSMAVMSIIPGFEKAVEEMKKVDGFPVLTTTTSKMMGTEATTTSELIEFGEKKAPAGTYELPKGYKKDTFGM